MTEPEFARVKLKKTGKLTGRESTEGYWFDGIVERMSSWFVCGDALEPEADTERRPTTVALERMKNRAPLPPCAGCKQAMVSATMWEGLAYHASCVHCGRCGGSVDRGSATAWGLRCASCKVREAQERSGHVTAAVRTTAGEREVAVEGDVIGVLDAIGDELEAIVANSAPVVCQICGGAFTGSDAVVRHGVLAWHAECRATGKPRHGAVKSRGGLHKVAEAAADLLVVRVSCGDTTTSRTFFFVKDTAAVDARKANATKYTKRAHRGTEEAEEVPYVADLSSKSASSTRRMPGDGPLSISIVGDPSFPDTATATLRQSGDACAQLTAIKLTYCHTYAVNFNVCGDELTALSCVLTVSAISDRLSSESPGTC